ncbi:hypothetical protein BJV77DRAFT_954673, partial [Russula vinacea]
CKESSVLVNNGLSFRLFDRTRGSWTMDSFSASNVSEMCIHPIPSSSPYRLLDHFVSSTHTPNDISPPGECPKEINLHEFIAYSGLRSGPRLQWLNIARELASPYLTFRRGGSARLDYPGSLADRPLSDGVHEWHIDLNIPGFGILFYAS